MTVTELDVNIANTAAFIAADPSVVTIKRDTIVSDGAGGKVKTGTTNVHVDESVRMIPQGADNATSNPITQTTNGSLDRPDFVLLALPGLGLARHDYFDWRGDTWKIDTIRPSPAYETKADVKVVKDD